jgi:GNAT superfamily N-acetyltransferase
MSEKKAYTVKLFDPKNSEQYHEIMNLIQEQTTENRFQGAQGIFDPNQSIELKKSQKKRTTFEKKVKRILDAANTNSSFGHIIYKDQPIGRASYRQVAIGFIFSHTKLAHPLKEHIPELKNLFPDLSKNTDNVLSGEYAYVNPNERGKGIGTMLFDAHEQAATKKGYTHRVTSVHPDQTNAKKMLEKRRYIHLATRPTSGFHIFVKKL